MMDGPYVLIVVGNKGWYHWSAWKVAVGSSQGIRTWVTCDVRALSIPLRPQFEVEVELVVLDLVIMDRGNVVTI